MKPYCIRCRRKVTMLEPIERRHTKNGRFLYIGRCNVCNQKVSMIRQERNESFALATSGSRCGEKDI